MSLLSNDTEALENGRKPLTDVEAPLRDQIPRKLARQLDALEMGQKVVTIWNGANSNRTEWLNRQRKFLKDWDEFLEPSAEGPFKGASSLHVPMPLTVAKTFHARMLQAVLGVDPPFVVRPRTEAGVDRAPVIQELMRYTLTEWVNYRRGIDEAIDNWIWDWVVTGVGILKWRWDTTYTRFIDVQEVPEEGPLLREVDENGQENWVKGPARLVEKEVPVTIKEFEGPICEHVHPEDVLIVGGQGDPDRADAVIHRQYLTASELWTLADRKIFLRDAVETVIDAGGDAKSGALGSDIKQDKARNAGNSTLDTDLDLDRYEILEAYLSTDLGDGINSQIIVWVHAASGVILRATYLHRTNRAGERPFVKIDFHKRAGQDYGIGLIEMLHPISVEMDAMHNLRIDMGLLTTMPFGFYRPTTIDAGKIEIEPGVLLPLDNPQTDVYFPNLGNRTSFGMQEEMALQNMVERLTSISDLSLGVMSGQQGAARTASGVRALVGESAASLDVYLRRMNRGWKKSLEYLFHMLQQRIPAGLMFRVTGDDGNAYFQYVKSQADLAGDFDFEISPNSASSNKAVQQEVAMQILQLTSNPIDIQLGLITPSQRYEAVKNVMQAYGVKEYGRYLQKPPQHTVALSPIEEANRVLAGVEVPVQLNSDHEGFIAWWELAKNTDEILGQFNEQQTMKLEAHARKHAQMMQALKEMAAQQANVAQMQRNASMGAQPAPSAPMAAAAPADAGGAAAVA